MTNIISKLFTKLTPPRPRFFILEYLPIELLLLVFARLPTRDLYTLTTLSPSNAVSEHAKLALLQRVFRENFCIRAAWCCCSCRQMNFRDKLVLQNHLNTLLYPTILDLCVVYTLPEPRLVNPRKHKISEEHKYRIAFALGGSGREVKLDVAQLKALRVGDEIDIARSRMQLLTYYYTKMGKSKRHGLRSLVRVIAGGSWLPGVRRCPLHDC
jgi:hypothetical protein